MNLFPKASPENTMDPYNHDPFQKEIRDHLRKRVDEYIKVVTSVEDIGDYNWDQDFAGWLMKTKENQDV